MATYQEQHKELGSLLNRLIRLEYDAVEAYEAAVKRLDTASYKEKIGQFLNDHRRHISDLRPLATSYCANVADGPDIKQILTKGKVVIAELGGDTAVLKAMQSNEKETNTAYEDALKDPHIMADVRPVLERNLADERRHKAWIEQCLSTGSEKSMAAPRAPF